MRELIYYGGLIGGSIYLIYGLYKQFTKNQELIDDINTAERNKDRAYKEFNNAKKEMISTIDKVYGKISAERVDQGTIWIGMPDILLKVARELPEDIREEFYKGTKIHKYYYDSFTNRLGNKKYKFEITLENSEVVGWRDIV